MTPRIRSVTVEQTRVTPAEAVLTVRVEADGPVRGKLVGPYLPGMTTVAVAYPLRPAGDNPLTLTAVIPEPNLWSPAAPFRYDGTVDLVKGAEKLDSTSFTVTLRAD